MLFSAIPELALSALECGSKPVDQCNVELLLTFSILPRRYIVILESSDGGTSSGYCGISAFLPEGKK